jgi:transcriptional regulator with XRE-family HTH domain
LEEKETLAQRVKRLRASMGWTRKELAERAQRPQDDRGLHPSHIGLIERAGRVDVSPETLEKIAFAFGVSRAYLLGDEDLPHGGDLEPYRHAIEAARHFGLDPDRLLQLINTTGALFAKK